MANSFQALTNSGNNLSQIIFYIILSIAGISILVFFNKFVYKRSFINKIKAMVQEIQNPDLRNYMIEMVKQREILLFDSDKEYLRQLTEYVKTYSSITTYPPDASITPKYLQKILNIGEQQAGLISTILGKLENTPFMEIQEVAQITRDLKSKIFGIDQYIDFFIQLVFYPYCVKVYNKIQKLQGKDQQLQIFQPNVCLMGDPGTGKSRLLDEFQRQTGIRVNTVFGTELNSFSFTGFYQPQQIKIQIGTKHNVDSQISILVRNIIDMKTEFSILFFDEFDKFFQSLGQSADGVTSMLVQQNILLPILNGPKDKSNNQFKDNFFIPLIDNRIFFDISNTTFVFAMNKDLINLNIKNQAAEQPRDNTSPLSNRLTYFYFNQPNQQTIAQFTISFFLQFDVQQGKQTEILKTMLQMVLQDGFVQGKTWFRFMKNNFFDQLSMILESQKNISSETFIGTMVKIYTQLTKQVLPRIVPEPKTKVFLELEELKTTKKNIIVYLLDSQPKDTQYFVEEKQTFYVVYTQAKQDLTEKLFVSLIE